MRPLVYCVDDDVAMRMMYRVIFEDYNVKVFKCGECVTEAMYTEIPDLIVSDLCMPFGDGYSVIDSARRLAPGVPIIIATAMEGTEQRFTVEAMGCRYWNKADKTTALKETAQWLLTTSRD